MFMTWMPIGFWYAGLKCVVYYYCQLCKDEDPKVVTVTVTVTVTVWMTSNSHCHFHSHYLWGPHSYTVDSSSRLPSRPLYLTCTAMAADSRKTKCLAVNVHRVWKLEIKKGLSITTVNSYWQYGCLIKRFVNTANRNAKSMSDSIRRFFCLFWSFWA